MSADDGVAVRPVDARLRESSSFDSSMLQTMDRASRKVSYTLVIRRLIK